MCMYIAALNVSLGWDFLFCMFCCCLFTHLEKPIKRILKKRQKKDPFIMHFQSPPSVQRVDLKLIWSFSVQMSLCFNQVGSSSPLKWGQRGSNLELHSIKRPPGGYRFGVKRTSVSIQVNGEFLQTLWRLIDLHPKSQEFRRDFWGR